MNTDKYKNFCQVPASQSNATGTWSDICQISELERDTLLLNAVKSIKACSRFPNGQLDYMPLYRSRNSKPTVSDIESQIAKSMPDAIVKILIEQAWLKTSVSLDLVTVNARNKNTGNISISADKFLTLKHFMPYTTIVTQQNKQWRFIPYANVHMPRIHVPIMKGYVGSGIEGTRKFMRGICMPEDTINAWPITETNTPGATPYCLINIDDFSITRDQYVEHIMYTFDTNSAAPVLNKHLPMHPFESKDADVVDHILDMFAANTEELEPLAALSQAAL